MNLLRFLATVAAFGAASLLVVGPLGCEAESSGTTGRRVALELRAVGTPAARTPFTNALGWNVKLSKALVATGPMTFYDGATIFSRAPLSFLGRSAFAHPGHYVPGDARGSVLAPSSVDLRSEVPTLLGTGEGVSGMFRSATFSFGSPAAGAFAGELGANVVLVEGSATKGADTKPFRVAVSADDVRNAKGAAAIDGCAFAEADVAGDGRITLTVKIELWFDQVDFAGGDAVVENALVRGIKTGTPYTFAFAEASR